MLSLCLALNRFSSIFYPFLWEINRNSFEDSNVLTALGLVTRVMTAADFSSNPTLFKYNGICADVTLFVRPKRTPVPVRVTPCRLGEGLNSQCCLLESQCRASTKKNPVPVNRGVWDFWCCLPEGKCHWRRGDSRDSTGEGLLMLEAN